MNSVNHIQTATGLSYAEGDPVATDYRYPTCLERFLAVAGSSPEGIALVSMYQSPLLYKTIPNQALDTPDYKRNPYLRWTYRSLLTGINQLASGLKARDVESGMLLLTVLPNGAEHVLSMMVARQLGCVYAPLNTRQLKNRDEFNHILEKFRTGVKGKQAVLVANDREVASQLDALDHEYLRSAIKIVCSSDNSSHANMGEWHELESIMAHHDGDKRPEASESGEQHAMVGGGDLMLCTSGTTSLPKTVLISVDQQAYIMHGVASDPRAGFTSVDNILGIVPNNHVMGWLVANHALMFGGTIVLPSPSFDIEAIVRAAAAESATYATLAPTMVRALAAAPGSRGVLSTLRCLQLGGNITTPDILDMATAHLGARKVGLGFGNTEGSIIRTGDRDPHELVNSDSNGENIEVAVSIMPPPQGMAIKVCREGGSSAEILPLGQPGEIHISSPGTCRGYIDLASDESSNVPSDFYADETGRWWHKMGDMARMDADGRLFIVGRYKDIISRGAEKIAPAAVEAVLDRDPALARLQIQIVGAPDDMAGEIPVALTRANVSAEEASAIRETVVRVMGPSYAPDEVISLARLGLDDYPRTMIGKVQRSKLTALVHTYYQQRKAASGSPDTPGSTLEKIKAIWSSALGLDPKKLSSDTRVAEFADSISFMRVRDRITKTFGKTLSLSELANAATIGDEVRLLDSKPSSSQNDQIWHTAAGQRDTPPEIDEMIHLTEAPEMFEATKQLVEEALQKFDPTLTWNNVREVMPAYDFIYISVKIGLMKHMNLKIPWVAKTASVPELRDALKVVFNNNPMMASFIMENETRLPGVTLLVTAEQSESLMNQILVDRGTLDTVADLQDFARRQHYPACSDAMPPAPLTKISLFFIKETGSAGLVLNGNHVVYDAILAGLVLEDLDAVLGGETTLKPHQSYKLWSEVYYSLRKSPAARAGVKFFVETRRGLHNHRNGVWPAHPPVYEPRPDLLLATDAPDGFTHAFDAGPGFRALRTTHPAVGSAMLLKAALVLFLRRKSGHTHALFAQVESERRRWPFLPGALGEQSSASDVGGQTIQSNINIVGPGADGETVLEFLQRLQADQVLQTRHAAAPRLILREAMLELGDKSTADLIPWIGSTAIFNWLGPPLNSTPLRHLRSLPPVLSPAAFSFFMWCGSTSSAGGLWMNLRGATFRKEELAEFARELEKLTQWVVNEKNWGRKVTAHQEIYSDTVVLEQQAS